MMSYKNTFEQLHEDIESVKSLLNRYQTSSGEGIPKIELDSAMAKLRNLYEVLSMIREAEVNETEDSGITGASSSSAATGQEHQEPPEEEGPEFEVTTGGDNEQDMQTEEEPPEETQESEAQPADTPEPPPSRQNEDRKTLADRFTGTQNKINENKGKKQVQDLAARLQSRPINDISKALGVNDKFVFAKELFNGDKTKFNETLNIINQAGSYEKAMEYIQTHFAWDTENNIYAREFINLIKRKYNTPS